MSACTDAYFQIAFSRMNVTGVKDKLFSTFSKSGHLYFSMDIELALSRLIFFDLGQIEQLMSRQFPNDRNMLKSKMHSLFNNTLKFFCRIQIVESTNR